MPNEGTGAALPGESFGEWALPIRALVLDIDDTLVDTQAAMRHSCTVGAGAAWPDEPVELHRAVSDVYYDDPAGHFDAYTRGEHSFAEMRHARYAVAMTALGLPDVRFEVFESAYRAAFAGSQHLFDDVAPLLRAVADASVGVSLLTNSGDEQTAVKLEQVGLVGIGPVVTTDTLGFGKPDPRVFARACAEVGAAPAESLVVGDTLPTDVAGGRAAGIRVAWLQRPGLPAPRGAGWGTPVSDPGVRVVGSLHDAAALLTSPSRR